MVCRHGGCGRSGHCGRGWGVPCRDPGRGVRRDRGCAGPSADLGVDLAVDQAMVQQRRPLARPSPWHPRPLLVRRQAWPHDQADCGSSAVGGRGCRVGPLAVPHVGHRGRHPCALRVVRFAALRVPHSVALRARGHGTGAGARRRSSQVLRPHLTQGRWPSPPQVRSRPSSSPRVRRYQFRWRRVRVRLGPRPGVL